MKPLKELLRLVEYYVDAERFDEAREIALICANELHSAEGLSRIKDRGPPPAFFTTTAPTDPSNCFELGFWYHEVVCDEETAIPYFSRAAAQGHVLAKLYRLQKRGGWGASEMEPLANMGCPEAAHEMTVIYDEKDPFQYAYWLSRAEHLGYPQDDIASSRSWVMKTYGRDALIPYGRWRPDLHIHRMVSHAIHWSIFRWLLIAKRVGVPRYVAYIVASYIVTK